MGGGYQRLGDLIRITARFVEVGSGAVVRTVKIDGAIGDIFSLQDKIVFELSQGMNLTLEDSEMAEIERQATESVETYENRSRAMMNILEGSPQALDHAILLLEKATRLDPNYAAAWAALAASDHALRERSLIELHVKLAATYHRMDQPADANRHCTEAVTRFERRVARGADDPATKYYIASLYGLRGDAEKAVRYLRKSIAALPALNRVRATADPDFDPIRADPAFAEALARATMVSLAQGSGA